MPRILFLMIFISIVTEVKSPAKDHQMELFLNDLILIDKTIKWCNDESITIDMNMRKSKVYESIEIYLIEKDL